MGMHGESSLDACMMGKQCDTVEDFKQAIDYEWEKLTTEFIRKVLDSMPNRFRECQVKGRIKCK